MSPPGLLAALATPLAEPRREISTLDALLLAEEALQDILFGKDYSAEDVTSRLSMIRTAIENFN